MSCFLFRFVHYICKLCVCWFSRILSPGVFDMLSYAFFTFCRRMVGRLGLNSCYSPCIYFLSKRDKQPLMERNDSRTWTRRSTLVLCNLNHKSVSNGPNFKKAFLGKFFYLNWLNFFKILIINYWNEWSKWSTPCPRSRRW